MRFGKDHKAIISSLEGDEVDAYIDFLEDEVGRHEVAIEGAECNIRIHIKYGCSLEYDNATTEFYNSAIKRHLEDIRMINENIRQAKMLKGGEK